jgi:hypothetical protein
MPRFFRRFVFQLDIANYHVLVNRFSAIHGPDIVTDPVAVASLLVVFFRKHQPSWHCLTGQNV